METTVIEPKPAFTPLIAGTEQAKEISKQGWIASKAKRAERKAAKLQPCSPLPDLDEFAFRRLLRVREQLDIIDKEIKRCLLSSDPEDLARVKPLVESSSRLSEQERFAANRPGPGTRKPAPVRQSRQDSELEPNED